MHRFQAQYVSGKLHRATAVSWPADSEFVDTEVE
jgi:hypothetical protein